MICAVTWVTSNDEEYVLEVYFGAHNDLSHRNNAVYYNHVFGSTFKSVRHLKYIISGILEICCHTLSCITMLPGNRGKMAKVPS